MQIADDAHPEIVYEYNFTTRMWFARIRDVVVAAAPREQGCVPVTRNLVEAARNAYQRVVDTKREKE